MKKIFGSILDIRKGEVGITLLMLANIYLIMVTYYFLKPARDSLFLSKLGAGQLPLVFILTAFVIVPITTIYAKASRRLKLNNLIISTTLIIIACLVVLRWMMGLPYVWVPYVFYIWVSVYGVLVTSQFWLLANSVYSATQAKRLFALLGLGAILGAWTGGEVSSLLIGMFDNVTTKDLPFFCIGFLVISMIITTSISFLKRKEIESQPISLSKVSKQKESFLQMFGTIKRSQHLLMIVGIITLTMIVASLVDFQFKAVASMSKQGDELTAFMGVFYGRLSLVSFFLQLIFAYRFLRILGVGGVILFLPMGLLVASTAMLFYVNIFSAVLLRGADGSLKYSIDKTGRELLFLPLPLDIKKRTKVFIDMFVDRWARGLSGGLILLLIVLFNYDNEPHQAIRYMSIVVIGFLAVWIFLALKMRKEYVDTFRQSIKKREIDLSEIRTKINESSTINALISSLKSNNDRDVDYALDMLSEVKNSKLIEPLKQLLKHSSSDIRRRAINVLLVQGDSSLTSDVKPLLNDDNVDVSRDALNFMYKLSAEDTDNMFKIFLSHPEVKYRYVAVSCIVEYGDAEHKKLIDETIIDSLINLQGDEGVAAREQVARALGYFEAARFSKYIKRLLNDSSPVVVSRMIKSIGRIKDREYVTWLLKVLAHKDYRVDARNALASFGVGILGTLNDYLTDENIDISIRKRIPRVLSQIPDQKTVDTLTGNINKVNPTLKYYVLKALNKLRNKYPNLKFNESKVNEALIAETKSYYEVIQVIKHQKQSESNSSKLLIMALEEKQDQNLERIFRILGLHYPPKDIYSAYQRIIGDKHMRRATAIEFLDNLLKSSVKKYIIPIIESSSSDRVLQKGQELFGIKFSDKVEALLYLIKGHDDWLKACAIYSSIDEDSSQLKEAVKNALNESDPVVRETAEFVMNKKT